MWRSQMFMLVASASVLSATAAPEGTTSTSPPMERYALPSAICADGSPGFFYMAANASSNDFAIRVMGGGGCAYSENYCQEIRDISPLLFTSDGWPDTTVGFGMLSGDASENPLYSTFNRVVVPYCTQDMFLLDTESPGGELQFRGRPYLEEVLASVLGQSANGSTAVLLGSSAGGVGTFNVASWLLDSFTQVSELSMVLDSSFFFDVNGTLTLAMDYMSERPSAAYSSHCSEEFDGGPCCVQFSCMVYRGYYPKEDERLKGTMLLSPAQDVAPFFLETADSVGATPGTQNEDEDITFTSLWDVAAYTGQTRSLLHTIATIYPAAISIFAPSCVDHPFVVAASADLIMCLPEYAPEYEKPIAPKYYDYFVCTFGEDDEYPVAATYVRTLGGVGLRTRIGSAAEAWENLQIDGTNMRAATEQWWAGRGDDSKQVFLFDSCDDLSCNPTCRSELLPGTRDETDDMLVWVVVLVTSMAAVLVLAAGIFAVVWGLHQGQRAVALVASTLGKAKKQDIGGDGESSSSLSDLRLQISMATGSKENGREDGGGSGAPPILEWRALSYWLPPTTGPSSLFPSPPGKRSSTTTTASPREKQLLHSVHGSVPEGALCALMGPSGSGKSTLLDLLTGRKDFGRCDGEVLFRGRSIANQQEAYVSHSGYMRQVDTGYLDGLTVLENLVYAAMLRLPGTLEHQSQRVRTVIEQTSLDISAHTLARGLSGGQKRRLKIALELLVDRQIFFLDEPSSGLDATASLELVALLKRLSRKVTLVVAIHQPRPEVWELFSHVILLSGGRTVYCGPTGSALAGTASYLVDSIHSKPSNAGISREPTGPDTAGDHLGRLSLIFGMRKWDSQVDVGVKPDQLSNDDEEEKSSARLTRAPTESGNGTHADPRRTGRSIPDKILDRLMMIETELGPRPQEAEEEKAHGSRRGDGARNKNMPEETLDSPVSTAISGGDYNSAEKGKIPVWKVAAVLIARSCKNGYAKELVSSSAVFMGALTFIMVSLRVASDTAMMLHLVLSVVIVSTFPALLVYAPIMLVTTYHGWPLTKLEIADGFYTPRSATVRYVIDQFAAAVLISVVAVGTTHAVFWGIFISELPASTIGVDLQLSCAMTLTAWVMISLFDALVISGISFEQAVGASNTFNTIWVFFSGTMLLVKSIPAALRAVTYTSPHYWTTFFGVRVLLDGLDLTNSCNHNSKIYCPTSYGDLVVHTLDLHIHTTALSLICLVAMATSGLIGLAVMVHVRGRHVRIIGGLEKTSEDTN